MYKFAHISDLHIPDVPRVSFMRLLNKRVLGYLSWQRERKDVHTEYVLKTLITYMKAQHPEHICLTGDVINIGLPEEFEASLDWLKEIGQPEDVSVIPGNHDIYVRCTAGVPEKIWHDWMCDDDGNGSFPYVRIRGNVAFIGISSAVPTAPFMAYGRVSRKQTNQLAQILPVLAQKGLFRVVMIHHPPHAGATSWRKGMLNAAPFRDVIGKYGCELILHGHLHRQLEGKMSGPSGDIPVLGCGAASMNGEYGAPRAHFYTFELTDDNKGWTLAVENHNYMPEAKRFASQRYKIFALDKAG